MWSPGWLGTRLSASQTKRRENGTAANRGRRRVRLAPGYYRPGLRPEDKYVTAERGRFPLVLVTDVYKRQPGGRGKDPSAAASAPSRSPRTRQDRHHRDLIDAPQLAADLAVALGDASDPPV